MRKSVSIFFILLGLALLIISTSAHLMEEIISYRSSLNGWFGIHHSAGVGDLASMSYLDNVKRFQEKSDFNFVRPKDDTAKKNIDLYIYGDSYLETVPDSAFSSINSYHFGRRNYYDLTYSLDPHKKNILIIEIAERFARVEFELQDMFNHAKKKDTAKTSMHLSLHPLIYTRFPFFDDIFNPDINRNLEFNIFGYRFWDQVKLTKALMTYHLFKRAVGDAVVSDDGSRLFLKQTMVNNDRASSYYPIDQTELQKLFVNLNAYREHYKAEGFDEVYLSIIPNPVTILQPGQYNNLIPLLQQQDSVKGMHIIDMYSIFKKDPDPGRLFRLGDTHWNFTGLQIWLNDVNDELRKQNRLGKTTIK